MKEFKAAIVHLVMLNKLNFFLDARTWIKITITKDHFLLFLINVSQCVELNHLHTSSSYSNFIVVPAQGIKDTHKKSVETKFRIICL